MVPDWLTVGGFLAAASTPGGKKIIETLSAGMGTVYRPIGRILDARAEVAARRILAEGDLDIADALAERIRSREVRKEQNIDAVASKTYAHLPPVLPPTPVDPDWTAQFLRTAGDVSNEQMQEFWARLLAGEISSPGSYSKRSVSTLGVMSHTDAVAVERLSAVVWQTDEGAIALTPDESSFADWGLSEATLLELQSLGIVSDVSTGMDVVFEVPRGKSSLSYNGWLVEIDNTGTSPIAFGTLLRLTSLGVQLCRIAGIHRNDRYFGHVVDALRKRKGLEVNANPTAL